MMPCVTVLPNPNGLLIARTVSPTCRVELAEGDPQIGNVGFQHRQIGFRRCRAHASAGRREHDLDVVGFLDHDCWSP
jgi:hypothetical protein